VGDATETVVLAALAGTQLLQPRELHRSAGRNGHGTSVSGGIGVSPATVLRNLRRDA